MREEHLEVHRKHGPTVLERIQTHLDSIVAGVLLVVLVLQTSGVILKPGPDLVTADEAASAEILALETVAATTTFPVDERLGEVSRRVSELVAGFRHSDKPVTDVSVAISYPAAWLKTFGPGESNEIRFAPAVDLRTDPTPEGINVSWAEPAGNNVRVGGWEVLRSAAGGEEATVARLEGAKHVYRDTDTQPGRDYAYRVVAVASDPELASTPRGRTPPSEPVTVRAIADHKLELVDVKDGVASVRVRKWSGGSWRDRVFEVREGDDLGAKDEALGADFSTGRKVAAVTKEKSEVKSTRELIVFDAAGRVVVENNAPKRVTVTRTDPVETFQVTVSGGGLPDEVLELEKR